MKKILSILMILSMFVVPVSLAQEATNEPEPTPEAVATEVVEVIEVPVEDNDVLVDEDTVTAFSWQNIVLGLLASVFIAVAGGGGLFAIISRFDKRGKDALEAAYKATSPADQERINGLIRLAENLTKLLETSTRVAREVTDGLPNTEPPTSSG